MMKQSALIDRRCATRLSLIVSALACLCLSLSASLLLTIPVKGEREETASSLRSAQTIPQTRALLSHTEVQTNNSTQRQSRIKRPLTHIEASLGNFNVLGHSDSRRYSLDRNASPSYAFFLLSWQQGRAPPRA
ncbi:MAG TPA: hypothetical protein VF779_12860 [Pyrinomonadaceae bacterium]